MATPHMIRDAILALGFTLTTATQLRSSSAGVGPGEAFLVIWLTMTLASPGPRRGSVTGPALSRMLVFWTVFALAEALGTLMGMAVDSHRDFGSFLHDTLAYLLMAAVSCLSVSEPNAEARLRRVAWFVATFGGVILTAQLANAWGAVTIGSVDPWYWDRLRGWSENPNELALNAAVLCLVSLHLAETATHWVATITAAVCTALSFYVGILTKSDAFLLVAMVGVVVFLLLKFRVWLFSFDRRLQFRSAVLWIAVLSLPLVLLAAAPFATSATDKLAALTTSTYKDDHAGEAAVRMDLWREALNLGVESGLLGLGPGPHITRIAYKREPWPAFEAHNTSLDLLTQGGLLAVLSVIWLLGTSFVLTLKAQRAALTTLVCGLAVFSTFHLIVRIPIFWFAITLCLVTAPVIRPPRAVRNQG